MSFAAGVFSLAAGNPVVSGSTIQSSWANSTLSDIATGLSTCVLKDGTQIMTANLPMAGFKLTGLGSGTAAADSATFLQAQTASQAAAYLTGVAGTNTITATATPAATLAVGQRYWFFPAVTNTGAVTLQIGANTAGAIQRGGNALIGQELTAPFPVEVIVSAATPVFQIVASGQIQKQPTRQVFTSGSSATYTTPAGATRINVRMVGGGGGGGGATANNGTAGNATTFSGSSLNAAGGSAGAAAAAGQAAGGAGTNGDINISGGGGQGGIANSVASVNPLGGQGGSSAFGGGGAGGAGGQAGANGGTNSGGGGGGGGGASTTSSGGGGGSGGYVEKLFTAPAATYTYTVGAGANGGAAGGTQGGAGAAGIIIVDEFYN